MLMFLNVINTVEVFHKNLNGEVLYCFIMDTLLPGQEIAHSGVTQSLCSSACVPIVPLCYDSA